MSSVMDKVDLRIDDEQLRMAVSSVVRGGEHAIDRQDSVVSMKKGDGSTVTEADRESEKLMREILGEGEVEVAGEELDEGLPLEGSFWAVDPIDGTRNYSYGQPLFCTSVGLVRDGYPVLGAIYIPSTGQLFYAKEGENAYLNESELSVTDAEGTESLYMTADGYGTSAVHDSLCDVSYWIQRPHAAAIAVASVGAGWVDFGVFGSLAPWDVAAGIVIVEEAGGVIKSVSEEQNVLEGGFLAWNGNPEIVETVREALGEEGLEELAGSKHE